MTAPADRAPDEKIKLTVSRRSAESLAAALQGWLAATLATPDPPVLRGVRVPDSGGLSSTSVLFEAEWISEGTPCHGAYVARLAPEPSALPVFPRYDLPGQFELIKEVTARC